MGKKVQQKGAQSKRKPEDDDEDMVEDSKPAKKSKSNSGKAIRGKAYLLQLKKQNT
eukprot:NODE_1685_length_1092_cov_104.219559_g1372_i0.p2 GENE.NODE_1685_length_1092_cov_104.219559_g1372_i0~~NODE_1685_length_1092_cov_104.219559_g1372_i0.p2  ORF type:complete len:56 (-),score=9.76 NODE_1685_length_1092_cov_104.219559_g1372_i0:722-889(-)